MQTKENDTGKMRIEIDSSSAIHNGAPSTAQSPLVPVVLLLAQCQSLWQGQKAEGVIISGLWRLLSLRLKLVAFTGVLGN